MSDKSAPKVTALSKMAEIHKTVTPIITAGNVGEAEKLRKQIVRMGKAYAALRKSFDDQLKTARSFQKDYLEGIETIRQDRKPKSSGEKPASVFEDDDLFD